jgi:hypothetical protein
MPRALQLCAQRPCTLHRLALMTHAVICLPLHCRYRGIHHVESHRETAGAVDGSAWLRLGGAAARVPPGPRAPAVCCDVLTYAQQSSCRPLSGAARLGCGLSGRRGCGWGGPALVGRRALAPKPYAALYGPLVSRSCEGLVWMSLCLDAGCRDGARRY